VFLFLIHPFTYVSIFLCLDRTIDELSQSELEWQFWTKIVVEAIGCLGAGILFYVWGKIYFCLIRKWISFNRTFVIIDELKKVAPVPLKPPSITNLQSDGGGPETDTGGGGGGEKGNLEARALLLPPVYDSEPPLTLDTAQVPTPWRLPGVFAATWLLPGYKEQPNVNRNMIFSKYYVLQPPGDWTIWNFGTGRYGISGQDYW